MQNEINSIPSFEFVGTAREFEDNRIRLNGEPLDAVTVSSLARHGLLEYAGEGTKPSRGRTPKKYKAVSREGMQFSFKQIEVKTTEQSSDINATE
jgi:hypothetical protein